MIFSDYFVVAAPGYWHVGSTHQHQLAATEVFTSVTNRSDIRERLESYPLP